MTAWLHNWIWIQQDYLWFLAGIGWLAVAALAWQHRRSGDLPGWLPWSAAAGVATAVAQMLILISPVVQRDPYQLPSLRGDLCLGAVIALQAVGWWATGLRGVRGRPVLVAMIAALVIPAAAWRYANPTAGTLAILVTLSGAAALWCLPGNRPDGAAWRIPILVALLAAFLDTTGPLAAVTLGEQRWFDASPFGPWSALAHCLAASVTFWRLHRFSEVSRENPEERRVERWFLGGIGAWLLVGLLLAIAAGEQGRRAFERSALGRARALAALIPMEHIERLLSDAFTIGEPTWYYFENGSGLPIAHSDHAEKHAGPVTRELQRIVAANPDLQSVTISTLRNNWLIAAAIGEDNRTELGRVTLLRAADVSDLNNWNAREAAMVGPVVLSPGDSVFARAPLVSRAGNMLGWLNLNFNVSQWLAAQAQPRTLAYLVIACGLVIGRQLLTQRIRARERDRARAAALQASQASQLKTAFLANVSHELRTPLQSIQGYTELILPHVGDREREKLLAVREHADLMARLVNDLIDLSAAESGKFHLIERPVALAEIVVQAAESLRPRAEAKQLAFSVRASSEIPPWLFADPQRVRQVVLNLVGNAVKYTDLGSVDVHLALAARHPDAAEVELRVSDTGPGIPADAQAHLFEPFHRLDRTRDREGAGLGLAIVDTVSKAMGGSVHVESDGRRGSVFVARWRLRVAPDIPARSPSNVPLHGKRVLVADDNELVRDLFVAYLTECGAICATAADGADAIRRLRTEVFDALVLDLAMPRLDGLSLVRQIRRELPDRQWRIVGVSAHAGAAEHDEALAAGMDAFLVKPVTLPDLARALASSAAWTPPTRSFQPIRAHFSNRFRESAAAQSAAVARAVERGNWAEIRAAAHYLKNSADVVGDDELSRTCAALEAAARARDPQARDDAWCHCRLALARWLSQPAAN